MLVMKDLLVMNENRLLYRKCKQFINTIRPSYACWSCISSNRNTLHLRETLQQHHVKATGLRSALRNCVPASASSRLHVQLARVPCNAIKRDTAMLQHVVFPARSTPDRTPRGLGRHELPSARGAASSVNVQDERACLVFVFTPRLCTRICGCGSASLGKGSTLESLVFLVNRTQLDCARGRG